MKNSPFVLIVTAELSLSASNARNFAHAVIVACIPAKFTSKLGMSKEAYTTWSKMIDLLQDVGELPRDMPSELVGLFFGHITTSHAEDLSELMQVADGNDPYISLSTLQKANFRKTLQVEPLLAWAKAFVEKETETQKESDEQIKKDEIRALQDRAKRLGFTLVKQA